MTAKPIRTGRTIAVIGAGTCDGETADLAREAGRLLAEAGCVLVSGGLGGVMEAASEGARAAGGTVVGILPTADPGDANPHVTVSVATGMGDARNAIIANTAAGFLAIAGAYGTLSEIAFALKRNKPVVSLGSWDIDPRVHRAETPAQAVKILFDLLP